MQLVWRRICCCLSTASLLLLLLLLPKETLSILHTSVHA
jgi:hypothetical protein